MRVAVVGHVEHITLGRVAEVPRAGEIAHLEQPRSFPGGGGGLAFFQLARSPGEAHLFTALGSDDAARDVEAQLARLGAQVHVHAARRDQRHTRDLVLIDAHGERTIVVGGEPLHPRREDPLPWDLLAQCDAAYFTAQDPAALRAARAAKVLVVTARRRHVLAAAAVQADVVVGSRHDPREVSTLADYPIPPAALVLTAGKDGGEIHTAEGVTRFAAPPAPPRTLGSYGAGDSFAGALTWYLGRGWPVQAACIEASRHGAAVLGALEPLEAQIPLR